MGDSSLPFDIQVALLGCKFSTTHSFLNSILGDDYLPIIDGSGDKSGSQLVVDSFRIITNRLKHGISLPVRISDSVREEITQRFDPSFTALCSKNVYEVTFNVSPTNDLTRELRDDSTFLFVKFPPIDVFTKSSVENILWQRLRDVDRIIAVVDSEQDHDSECENLLRFIKQSIRKRKNIPITLVCITRENEDADQASSLIIKHILGEVRSINEQARKERMSRYDTSRVIPQTINILSYDSDDDDKDDAVTSAVDTVSKVPPPDDLELVDFVVVSVETELDDVVQKVQDLAGDKESQMKVLKEQKDNVLEKLDASLPFARILFSICAKYMSLEEDPNFMVLQCVEKFWKLYEDCANHAFAKFESDMDPMRLTVPMEQLIEFKTWMKKLELNSEMANLEAASTILVKRQLQLILHKNSLWSFDEWYREMNSIEWRRASCQDWYHVSPSDWNTIISSLLLTSSDCYFYESFGREKIMLERARFLSNDHLVKTDASSHSESQKKFSAADGCPSLEHSLDGSYERGRFRPKYPTTFECVVRFDVPDKLSNKKHWGHISWKHCQLMRSLEHFSE